MITLNNAQEPGSQSMNVPGAVPHVLLCNVVSVGRLVGVGTCAYLRKNARDLGLNPAS